jgi:ABC-type lipoprotein export system ATPase subunit
VDIAILKGNKLADFRFENIGFIFQSFNLLPTLTALENVTAPLFPRKVPFDKIARATELLDQVGLADKLNSLPSQLSGGEQQRVAIARALVNKPKWLLADEPTGNLDSKNGENIYELIHTIKRENNCGVLLVTHDLQLASRGDRMIEMKDGAVIRDSLEGEQLC